MNVDRGEEDAASNAEHHTNEAVVAFCPPLVEKFGEEDREEAGHKLEEAKGDKDNYL